jgi:hypothetical protein
LAIFLENHCCTYIVIFSAKIAVFTLFCQIHTIDSGVWQDPIGRRCLQ